MSDGFIFYLGMMAGIFSLAVFQAIVLKVRDWPRRNFSRHDERYTPERKQEEVK
jgi:hypothetical protein